MFPEGERQSGRIVKGFDTKKPLPYQLSMQLGQEVPGFEHFCSATLITSKFAISALHCFWKMYKSIIYEVDHYIHLDCVPRFAFA